MEATTGPSLIEEKYNIWIISFIHWEGGLEIMVCPLSSSAQLSTTPAPSHKDLNRGGLFDSGFVKPAAFAAVLLTFFPPSRKC